jgi:uncharacterized protein
MQAIFQVGLIADTHGLLRPQALEALRGSDAIVHAGDIGNPQILQALGAIAPVTAVRGNNDQAAWADGLPAKAVLQIGAATIHVVHDLADFEPALDGIGVQAVISGHSHRPKVEQRARMLFVNPGSAGPRRFKLPISVAVLTVREAEVTARLIELAC